MRWIPIRFDWFMPATFWARIFWSIIPTILLLLVFHGVMDFVEHRQLVTGEFMNRGQAMAGSLASSGELAVFAEDRQLLESTMQGVVGDPDVAYVVIYGEGGKILAKAGKQVRELTQVTSELSPEVNARLFQGQPPFSRHMADGGGRFIEFFAPIRSEETKTPDEFLIGPLGRGVGQSQQGKQRILGAVRLGLSLQRVEDRSVALLKLWGGVTLVFFSLSTLTVYVISRRITRPIKRLTANAQMMAEGVLDQQIPVESRDEIGKLAATFNDMARALKGNIEEKERVLEELQDLNRTLEDRIRQRTAELQDKSQELELANRHKSEFLANMSHELRTPLNAVIGFSEVLLERMFGELNEKQDEYLQDILYSGRHLLSLINDILDLSKIEAGRMELELTTFDLPMALKKALTLVRERASRHGIELSLEVDERVGDFTADERKVKQVLLNLLSNAVKFTPDGGTVSLRGGLSGEHVEISLSDTGIGIAPEDQQQIFEAFRQVGSDYARKGEGSGLGLTLAKKFVELHGGRIWVESEVGHGSTFTFTLPMRAPVREVPASPAVTPALRSQHHLVLVVEDDPLSAKLLSTHLIDAGFPVEIAHDGEAGFEKARALRPAVITLDILMPRTDGWALLARLKADPQTALIPVVIVSILDERGKGFALGAAEYLVKPVDPDELVRVVRRFAPVLASADRKVTVLAVDDDPMVLELMQAVLEPQGFGVLKAGGGAEGLTMAREQSPDLIVLDLLMPEVDGFQVVEELKRDPLTLDIPIVILTAKTLTSEDKDRLRGGIAHLTRKGEFGRSEFIALLNSLLPRGEA